jgi:hypothetical protein
MLITVYYPRLKNDVSGAKQASRKAERKKTGILQSPFYILLNKQ